MNIENQSFVTNEPVEVQDFRRITAHFEESIEYTSNQ